MKFGTEIVENPSDLPSGEGYVFHVAPAEHVESILFEGLDSNRESVKDWTELDEYLRDVASDANLEVRFDRGNCVFAYPTRQRANEVTTNLNGYATLVIELGRVKATAYTASYGSASAVMGVLRESGATLDPESEAYQKAVDYWESVRVYDGGFGEGEVLFPEKVSPSAITHVFGDTSYLRK